LADFCGFLAPYRNPDFLGRGSRITDFGSRFTASRSPDRCPLPTRFDRRLPVAGCRITASQSRPVFAGWYVWDKERGAGLGRINSFNGAMLAGGGH